MAEGVEVWGLGFDPPRDTTLEALQALESCRIVYADMAEHSSLEWLRSCLPNLRRPESALEVVKSALRRGRVGLAVWGHPKYTSRLASQVHKLCRREGVPFRVFAANSPAGAALARSVSFLGAEGYMGLQAYELEALLGNFSVFTPDIPLVAYSESGARDSWRRLIGRLRGRYPSDHKATIYPVGEDLERSASLSSLEDMDVSAAALLVLPVGPPGLPGPKRRKSS